MSRDVKMSQPPGERKKLYKLEFKTKKDLVLEISQKEFFLEKACDKMAVGRCKWRGQGWIELKEVMNKWTIRNVLEDCGLSYN